jgi:hypothetical protein
VTPESDDSGTAGSVTGGWVEVYPPDGEHAEDEPRPVVTNRGGLAAVLLFGVTLVLVVMGSLLPLAQAVASSNQPGVTSQTLSVDAWEITILPSDPGSSGSQGSPLPIGYPLLLAGLLVIAAIVLRVRAHRSATVVGAIAATFLSALVLTTGTFAVAWKSFGSSEIDAGLVSGIGTGYWVLVVGALVAIVGAVSLRSGRGEPPERDEPAPGE